jgi:hypothetical protein
MVAHPGNGVDEKSVVLVNGYSKPAKKRGPDRIRMR